MDRKSDNWPLVVRIFVCPTRAIFDSKLLRSWRKLTIKPWSLFFLALNVSLLCFLPPFWTVQSIRIRVAIGVLLYCIVFSRLMEIFYAFYYDVLEKLDEKGDQKTALSKTDRLRLAAQSYLEVSVCFAIFYRALPLSYFSNPATGPYRLWITGSFNWLYFSWITITTTGYGDVTPKAAIAKGLTMIEIAFGLMLIVFAVGAYFSSKNSEGPKEYR